MFAHKWFDQGLFRNPFLLFQKNKFSTRLVIIDTPQLVMKCKGVANIIFKFECDVPEPEEAFFLLMFHMLLISKALHWSLLLQMFHFPFVTQPLSFLMIFFFFLIMHEFSYVQTSRREISNNEKVRFLCYFIKSLLPFLEKICEEQALEINIDTCLPGNFVFLRSNRVSLAKV